MIIIKLLINLHISLDHYVGVANGTSAFLFEPLSDASIVVFVLALRKDFELFTTLELLEAYRAFLRLRSSS